jgi:hypothetical protein
MTERYTPKDAERQMAWLAKALGVKVHYLYLDPVKDARDIAMMAEPAQHREPGAWHLEHATYQGYNVMAYSDSGETHPLGERLHTCKDLWHALYIARMALSVDRGVFR